MQAIDCVGPYEWGRLSNTKTNINLYIKVPSIYPPNSRLDQSLNAFLSINKNLLAYFACMFELVTFSLLELRDILVFNMNILTCFTCMFNLATSTSYYKGF